MIAVEDLHKYYGKTHAVDGVTFQVHPGEVLGFLGPNGAGKTTTMKVLTGYLSADRGGATVAGHDVATEAMEVRRKIGYLPEHNALYTDMQVLEYLRFVASARGMPRAQARQAVDEAVITTDLVPYYRKSISALSKGYRQRVGLAAAVLHDPPVLILDEPTVGLDPNEIQKIRELIRAYGKTKTVILSTHILREVETTCDRVVIIAEGKIRADDTVEQLRQSAAQEERLSVGLRNPPEDAAARLAALEGVTSVDDPSREGSQATYVLHGGRDLELAEAVYALAREQSWELCALVPLAPTLEEAFARNTRQSALAGVAAASSASGGESEQEESE